jgi:hypothetical protein
MIQNLLEHGWLKQTHNSCVVNDVPDDARAVKGGWDGLVVILVDANAWNSASVFFQGDVHDLSLSADSPDSDFTFHTTWDYLLAVGCSADGGGTVVVSIVNCKEQLSRLWKETPDLAIAPSRQNRLAIMREEDAMALETWNFNSEELLSGLRVPDSNVVQTAGGEEFRVSSWEANIVDLLVVTSVSKFRADVISIAPIDGSLVGATEEVSGVSSQGNRCNCSHHFSLSLNFHIWWVHLCQGAISSSEEKVSVVQKVDAVNTLREESLLWPNSFKEVLGETDLNNISGLGAKIGKLICWVNDAASEHSLDRVHENLGVLNFLLDKVTVPCSDSVVVDSQALVGGGVVKLHLVGSVHANWISY